MRCLVNRYCTPWTLETFTLGAGKEHVAVTAWRFSKPGFQHGKCGSGKRCAALFAALADHAQVSTSPNDEVGAMPKVSTPR
jgi:hypothetical protein